MNLCWHNWSFPRRRARFGEYRRVDVETCVECGQSRLAPIQFAGSTLAGVEEVHASAKFTEQGIEA